ncbi:protein of unknown function DUF45 [Methanosalsum zhilinae DSM 4017]|uniref:YgjP-like metallopeptidase domain-containing protein n=1 Tax=Methanosalsum zhilinae (strain DSM 4017 / NBRC 107636 / OCM 62 / WeN5) TaxID=679901 RepID=F7XLA5_METZD|nr:SprT family zinc-dependent metalloprotease [Methanosalsum zhilinae]AEH60762.1 protein of unknown function DUF45 [Methanosalsum zhilinae DSM 4017]
MPSIRIENRTIEYELIFSSRKKTIGLQIDANNHLIVRAPQSLSEKQVNDLLNQRSKWIISNLDGSSQMSKNHEKKFVDGEIFLLKGQSYSLKIDFNTSEGGIVEIKDDQLIVSISPTISRYGQSVFIRNLLIDFYRKEAEKTIFERIKYYLKFFDSEPASIKIKYMKSRWGSCSGQNRLSFNMRIIMAKVDVIDYLIVHELCHLKHKNHSRKFWNSVKAILPDYEKRKKWLRENEYLLQL